MNIVELDPDDMTVGYGGLPNEDGGAAIWSGARFTVSVDGDTRREGSASVFERD